jgi:hypothetical protein
MSYVERPGKTVFRHGKRIKTIELVSSSSSSRRVKPNDLFTRSYRSHTALLRSAKVSAAVWNIYDELSWRDYTSKGRPFKLSNYILGTSHDSKTRALKKLEALGIIKVERPPRKTPLITFLHPAKGKNGASVAPCN